MDIETYIHEEDPYRFTSQASPWPLPLLELRRDEQTQLHATRFNQKQELIKELTAILKFHKIECGGSMRPFGVWSKPGYQHGNRKLTMFRIEAVATPEEPTGTWASARKATSELLSRHGFGELIVEIVDTIRAFSLALLPIQPDHVAVGVYEHCRQALVEVLYNHLDTRWINMSLYRVNIPHRAESVAVVVMVPPYTFSKALLLSCSNISPIKVFFVPGNNGRSAVQQEPYARKPLFLQAALPYPVLGQSLGFSDKVGGGTLGGFFRLRLGGKTRNGFLTSCQAVIPHQKSYEDCNTDSWVHEATSDPSLQIVCPHKEDTRLAVEYYRDRKRNHTFVAEWIQRIAQSGNLTIATEQLDRMRFSQRWVSEYTRRETIRTTLSNFLGNVLLSSGGRLNLEGQILDWAFVEITDSSAWNRVLDMNVLPKYMAFTSIRARHDLGQPAVDMYFNTDLHLALEASNNVIQGN
ncbi:MAG: hypothetical protein Q9183_006022, partial [Haloplaca sp. 2 TL-2023]